MKLKFKKRKETLIVECSNMIGDIYNTSLKYRLRGYYFIKIIK